MCLKDFVDSSSTGPITHFGEFFIGRPDEKYDEYASFPDRTGVDNLDFEFCLAINLVLTNMVVFLQTCCASHLYSKSL